MIKKLLKRLCLLFLLLLLWGYITLNLKSYSVYYAQRMPHGEGQMPEVIMLIDNLFWAANPEIEGIRYDLDGTRSIIDANKNEVNFGNIYSYETEYIYGSEQEISYRFNYKLELLHAIDNKDEKIDINTIDQDVIKAEIKAFVQPVIDAQPEPWINLQWLFNLMYQNKFK